MPNAYPLFRMFTVRLAIAGLITLLCTSSVFAQNGRHLWTDVARSEITQDLHPTNPVTFRAATVDLEGFFAFMTTAPLEERPGTVANGILVDIPLPNGDFATFRMVESSIMAPGLQARYPNIRTFLGQSVDTPSSIIRLSVTPHGVHAISSHEGRSFYLDPLTEVDKHITISYWLEDMPARDPHFHPVDEIMDGGIDPVEAERLQRLIDAADEAGNPRFEHGHQLRIYRFAVGANYQYVNWHSQQNGNSANVEDGLAAVVAVVNRVNLIYERDITVRFVLVENNDQVIFANAADDPYDNAISGTLLNQSQATLNSVIGSANYDVGHVFTRGGGGLAQVGVVCNAGGKGRAASGLPSPTTNVFAIQIVAHEIGHQFNAMHTFNASQSPCGPNRWAGSAVEPGSGSTIMSYAGSCGTQNIQGSADDYFHNHSMTQMINFITTGPGDACAQKIDLADPVPVAEIVTTGFNLPIETPFMMVGAFDYEGDATSLTFNWEGADTGPAGPPPGHAAWEGTPPFFRSVYPGTSTYRTFPRLDRIILNLPTIGEGLPQSTRLLRLRYTIRTNTPGGGAVADAAFITTVSGSAGPFVVTSQIEREHWYPEEEYVVTWDVANTATAALGAETVDILLSPTLASQFQNGTAIVLAEGIPNNGSATISIPAGLSSGQARVFVVASEGYFYAFNTHNLTLHPNPIVSNEDDGNTNAIRLSSVYPNPVGVAGGRATINLEVDRSQDVEVAVYDALGRFVRSLHSGMLNAGVNHQFAFSAQDFASGTYYIRAVGENFIETRPMTVVH